MHLFSLCHYCLKMLYIFSINVHIVLHAFKCLNNILFIDLLLILIFASSDRSPNNIYCEQYSVLSLPSAFTPFVLACVPTRHCVY